ncbi:MAG TPA: PrsW family glutamic-type intramembrane protease [Bacteroidota bacterium]|nr:PrsW family glutamic-type intramembrane protease [Bacteroidota bacterium]
MNMVSADRLLDIAVSLLPVFLFLVALVLLDSYKLVKLHEVVGAIIFGALSAVVALFVNTFIAQFIPPGMYIMPRYVAPVTEEILKSVFIVYLIRSGKVGFMVDAAIMGFAAGAGFAFMENVYYLQTVGGNSSTVVWLIRGFGTAVMHGGTAAMMATITKNLADRASVPRAWLVAPGVLTAMLIHSLFNHFPFPPEYMTAVLLFGLPPIMVLVFQQSEKSTREWLGVGFDTDATLLEAINTGVVSETKVGQYLLTLRSNFPGELVADMLCMLRIHLELSIRAKGILLMREHGFETKEEPDIGDKFAELDYLEKSVGKTGMLAIKPFLHTTHRDLWQLYMIGK